MDSVPKKGDSGCAPVEEELLGDRLAGEGEPAQVQRQQAMGSDPEPKVPLILTSPSSIDNTPAHPMQLVVPGEPPKTKDRTGTDAQKGVGSDFVSITVMAVAASEPSDVLSSATTPVRRWSIPENVFSLSCLQPSTRDLINCISIFVLNTPQDDTMTGGKKGAPQATSQGDKMASEMKAPSSLSSEKAGATSTESSSTKSDPIESGCDPRTAAVAAGSSSCALINDEKGTSPSLPQPPPPSSLSQSGAVLANNLPGGVSLSTTPPPLPPSLPFPLPSPNKQGVKQPGITQSPSTMPPSSLSSKSSKKRARNACVACKRAKTRCDTKRPCSRCVKRGMGDKCVDSVSKGSKGPGVGKRRGGDILTAPLF
eukprot:jgi/Bigna1/145111/aug1.95_g19819